MPESYSSGRDPRRSSGERPVRSSASRSGSSASRSGSARPQGARPAANRSSAQRSGARPQAARPQGSRPAANRAPQGRRPAARRKKRTQPRFFILLAAIIVILIVALIFIFGGKDNGDITTQPTAAPAAVNAGNDTPSQAQPAPAANAGAEDLVAKLGNADAEIAPLAKSDMVQVSDLSINTSLPQDWTNILLLGTDQRNLNESSRTDAMIICSINTKTGEVKLSSIMRDLAVKLENIGQYNGTYRINSASYFGGPEYAMKIVNECFDMNIQHYVMVNFFGFQKIAQALGGVEMDITEAEMNEINKNAVQQGWIGYYAGVDESDQVNEYLTTFGANTHLNGRQALAYARIRSIDSDFSRSDRQRRVLVKLMEKLKGKSAAEIVMLATSLSSNVSTNMDINKIVEIAVTVLNSGLSISSDNMFRLPVNNTYVQERRNEHEMFYDCDWKANALELYNFIYE